MPNFRLYQNSPDRLFAQWGPTYFDKDGKARLAKGSAAKDFYATTRDLVRARAATASWRSSAPASATRCPRRTPFSPASSPCTWTASGAACCRKGAKFEWGTAPLPVPDDQADTYGRGYLTGTVIGIAHSSKHQNAAWELVKFLTTDTDAVVSFANAIHNVPSTKAALTSPKLDADPQLPHLPGHRAEPDTAPTLPASINGGAVRGHASRTSPTPYEAGKAHGPGQGAEGLDKQIDARHRAGQN